MKKVVFVLCLFCSFTVFSQSDNTINEKRLKCGFNLGLNHTNILDKGMLPNNASLSNDLGIRLGLLADFKVSNFLSISPKAEMSFNKGRINFTNIDGSQTRYEIMPISIDFMAHFIFKKQNEKMSPFIFFGPNVKVPISKKTDNSTVYSTNSDFAIDFGVGLDNSFTYFNFSPELRYSFGLLNVNQHPAIQTLNFHSISLVFNFF